MKKKTVLALALTGALALSLTACGGDKQDQGTIGGKDGDVTIVTVGVVGSNNQQWDTVNELLAKDNIRVDLVEFSAYNLPNEALNSKEIDLNAFQHKAYLNNEIESQGYEIGVLCDTLVAPLSVYSDKITSLDQLQAGDKIAVPSDPTNEGRCFKILESAGVLEVDPAAGYVPELKDITSNPLNLEFVEMEASETANAIPDVACAFVNGAHAIDHGLKLADAIYTEQVQPGSDNPYINVIAVRLGEEDNEYYQKVAAAYQTAETAQTILDAYQGTYIPAFTY